MKIAIWYNLKSGGAKRALFYFVRGLLERGHKLESWCPPTADQAFLPLNELIPEHVMPFPKKSKISISNTSGIISAYNNIINEIKAMNGHCQQCAKEINQKGFDLLFAHPCSFFGVSPIARYVEIPKVIYLQEPYRVFYEALSRLPWEALPPPTGSWLSPGYIRKFLRDLSEVQGFRVKLREERLNAQAFDRILVNSFFTRESAMRAYCLNAKVCYMGVDTELFRPYGRLRESFVIGVGPIIFSKGIDRAVRAIGAIDKSMRPNLVWVANSSSERYKKELEVLAASLGVNLIFKMRAGNEIVDLLNRASVMIYTSRLEPFGLAVLEANACGVPVVGIAEGGIRESVRDGVNGILIDNDDPIALGKAILTLLNDTGLREKMSLAAREHVLKSWGWSRTIDSLEENFNYVMKKSKEAPNIVL